MFSLMWPEAGKTLEYGPQWTLGWSLNGWMWGTRVFGTYSLETNSSGDGVENGVSVGEVGEPPCLNPFKVHGLKRER